MKILLAAINSKYIHTGLGLRYVGESLKREGHQVELMEETINTPILRVLELLMESEVDVYGFSVHIWNKSFVFRLIGMLRKLKPKVTIVLGGPEVSFDVERIFSETSAVDYIVQGEGEESLPALLEALENDGEIPRHIAYVENGKVCVNGGPAIIEDLSTLPFPYPDLKKVVEEHKILYYEATRGCPFNCAYCLSSTSHNVRKRPLDLVLKDMDRFIAGGATLVKFVDRTYNLDEKYFLPMMKHLAAADTKATFHFEIKADMLSQTVLDFLKTVPKHRFQMEIGIQSTNPPTLKAINRKDNWDRLVEVVNRLLSFDNMHIHVDLIAGLPYESLEEFKKSFDDVYGLKAHMLQMGFLKVLPGTQMRRETELHDLRYMEEPPYEIMSTAYMPYKDMQLLKRMDNVHDQTGNSGFFRNALQYMVKTYDKGAFAFYEQLTNWWVNNGYYPQTHNVKGVAKLLCDFVSTSGLFDEEQKKIILEILRYDVFIDIPGWMPAWLNWQHDVIFDEMTEFWHNEELVKKYIPNYKAASWRQINKVFPVEKFYFNPVGEKDEFYLLLDCSGEDIRKIKLK